MNIDNYYTPSDYMLVTLYWSWDEYNTYTLPKSEWRDFQIAYENGKRSWKFKKFAQGSNVSNGGEIIDLSMVKRVAYY